ncbi:MAG: ATP/GTP-binding protein [Sphaerochaeta sp.]|uniref:AAA family ATPase n=1 Tax=Sphaerochaeta sp. TaxID=1972642 RepID=UPI002FC8CA1E
MLLDMTIANFKSVKSAQTISFEAVKDNRFPESKVVPVNEKLKLIKTAAIVGPNGAGKSSFVRALEALKGIICAPEESENPLQILSGTAFAYSEEKGMPATIILRVLIERDEETGEPTIAQYTLVADREKIFEESLYHIIGRSKKLMFERKLDESALLLDDAELTYSYRWGKMYRGEKKRLVNKVDEKHVFLSASAMKGSETTTKLYGWMNESLHLLPMGVSNISEKYLITQLTEHPDWVQQLINFLWSVDITDIRDIRVKDDRLIFIHTNVTQHYASYFSLESLSLRRLCLMGVAFFESFTKHKTLIVDDFGMLLHPNVLCHIVEIFEASNTGYGSQMLVVDCNPSLLKPGLLRRDGIYFAEKNSESATVYFSLANFKYSRSNDKTQTQYMNGAFGALPILSEFFFVAENTDKEE